MGSFTRAGEFKNREAFLAALRGKLEKLRNGTLKGSTLAWSESEASLEGFGARVVFKVGPAAWSCEATMPSFLPIPQRMIEAKFDQEFAELKGL